MTKVEYKIIFADGKIKIDAKSLNRFIHEVLYKFNGKSILSNVTINITGENTFEIICKDEYMFIVHGGFCLSGNYKNFLCCFRENTI